MDRSKKYRCLIRSETESTLRCRPNSELTSPHIMSLISELVFFFFLDQKFSTILNTNKYHKNNKIKKERRRSKVIKGA